MRIRRLEDELESAVARAPRPDSPWRIGQPLLLLTLLIPNFVLAYACTTDQGPWTARGDFGSGTIAQTLLLLSPLIIWAAGWLWSWEGDHDILEPRTMLGLLAWIWGLALCLDYCFSLLLAGGHLF
jgi:hypothetical protein